MSIPTTQASSRHHFHCFDLSSLKCGGGLYSSSGRARFVSSRAPGLLNWKALAGPSCDSRVQSAPFVSSRPPGLLNLKAWPARAAVTRVTFTVTQQGWQRDTVAVVLVSRLRAAASGGGGRHGEGRTPSSAFPSEGKSPSQACTPCAVTSTPPASGPDT